MFTSQVEDFVFPLPPLMEQQAIVESVEKQVSVLDTLESDIDTNLQKAEALRQSILKKAFAGELVPQDPNDEPASALLARIRAERAAEQTNSKPGRAAVPRRPNRKAAQQRRPTANLESSPPAR